MLVEDPELATDLSGSPRATAEQECLAPTVALASGTWDPGGFELPDRFGYGLLLLSGFLCRRVGQQGRFGAELLGPGDLLRPWQMMSDQESIPAEPAWAVIADCRLAVLGESFVRAAAPFPEVGANVVGRALLRARNLAINAAIIQQRRVSDRLQMLFWHLADRWGRVRGDGVIVEVPLTHALLGELVAARRPTVSTALSELTKTGAVERLDDGWRLRGGPPAELAEVSHP